MTRPGVFGAARYRTIDESRAVDMLLVHGWRFDAAASLRAAARRAAQALLDRCVALGLPFRTAADGGRLFDPAEVWNFLEWSQLCLGERTWEDQCVDGARRDLRLAPADDAGDRTRPPALDRLEPRRFALTLRRTFNLAGRAPGERVRLRLPLPLEDAVLGDVETRFLPPPDIAVETSLAPARLDAVLAVPGDGQAWIGVRSAFTAGRPPATAPRASIQPRLRSTPARARG